jgi:hypothetical protein
MSRPPGSPQDVANATRRNVAIVAHVDQWALSL